MKKLEQKCVGTIQSMRKSIHFLELLDAYKKVKKEKEALVPKDNENQAKPETSPSQVENFQFFDS